MAPGYAAHSLVPLNKYIDGLQNKYNSCGTAKRKDYLVMNSRGVKFNLKVNIIISYEYVTKLELLTNHASPTAVLASSAQLSVSLFCSLWVLNI